MNSYANSSNRKNLSYLPSSPWEMEADGPILKPEKRTPSRKLFADMQIDDERGYIREGLHPFHLRRSSVALLKGVLAGLLLGCFIAAYFLLHAL